MKGKYRLTHSNDFKRVRRTGRSYAHPLAVIVVGKGTAENSRAGFLVTRSVGGAVQRNRTRRQLRAIIAAHITNLAQPSDIVIIPREPASRAKFQELKLAVEELLRKAGLIVTDNNGPGR